MVEICPTDRPELPELFDPRQPNRAELEAVLAARSDGVAVVDSAFHPRECVLRSRAYMTFPSSGISRGFLVQGLEHLSAIGPMWLIWDGTLYPGVEPPPADSVGERIGFTECDPASPHLERLRQSLPRGLVVRRIDCRLLERCEWRDEMEFFCGSLDNFLAHGLGVCLMRGDEILAEAYATAFGLRVAEIGAVTPERHRRRGYALLTCSFLIELCRVGGHDVYWSCDVGNESSAGLARRIGFKRETRYAEYKYKAASSGAA